MCQGTTRYRQHKRPNYTMAVFLRRQRSSWGSIKFLGRRSGQWREPFASQDSGIVCPGFFLLREKADVKPHGLRCTFGTWFLQANPRHVGELAELMDNSNLSQVRKYALSDAERARAGVSKL